MTFYIAPRFLKKLAVHITKNYIDLPKVKMPLILGIHGRKGQGKTFQCELVYQKMGVEVVHISAGELESPDAGDPARLLRLRYQEAADLIRTRGKMAALMINDLEAGAGRVDQGTQYTVNTQLVNATLMHIAVRKPDVSLPHLIEQGEFIVREQQRLQEMRPVHKYNQILRSPPWKSCSSIQAANTDEAISHLEACLSGSQGNYVRVFGVDPDKRRVLETLVQQPQ